MASEVMIAGIPVARLAGIHDGEIRAAAAATSLGRLAANKARIACNDRHLWHSTVARALAVVEIAKSRVADGDVGDGDYDQAARPQAEMDGADRDENRYTHPGFMRDGGASFMARQAGFDETLPAESELLHLAKRHARSPASMLSVHDSYMRAACGAVRLNPNDKASKETQRLIRDLNTRAKVLYIARNTLRNWYERALEPETIQNRAGAMRNWEPFMREVMVTSPYRMSWEVLLHQSTPAWVRIQEENYIMAFAAVMSLRCSAWGSVENMISAVRMFHLEVLDISVPEFSLVFPRWANMKAKGKIIEKKKPKTRRRRPTFKTSHITEMCTRLLLTMDNDKAKDEKRHDAGVLLCLISAGFTLLFRVGELAKAAKFDPLQHWSIQWLRPLLKLGNKQVACVLQPKRKRENEFTREAMPIVYRDTAINFAHAVQCLTSLRDGMGKHFPDDADFFSRHDGSSPTPDWVGTRLKSLARYIIPIRTAMLMDYSDHCLRRGGETALDINGVATSVQEHAGAWAPGSSSRPLYIARAMERLADAQYQIADTADVTILQDQIGFDDSGSRGASFLETPGLDNSGEELEDAPGPTTAEATSGAPEPAGDDEAGADAHAAHAADVRGEGWRFTLGASDKAAGQLRADLASEAETASKKRRTTRDRPARSAQGSPNKSLSKAAKKAEAARRLTREQAVFRSFFTQE